MMRYGFSGTWRSFTTAGGGPDGGQALLVQPRLEFFGLGVGGDRPLEQLPLHGQPDRVRRRVALAPPPSPLRRIEGGEEFPADLAWAGRRVALHASSWRSDLHQPPPTSTNLHQPRIGGRSAMRASIGYPGRSGRR